MKKLNLSSYRKMLNKTQSQMAQIFCITRQSYALKEKGAIPFSDKEKVIFKDLIKEILPSITIDDIFFN